MDLWLAADPPFFGGPGQGVRQIVECSLSRARLA
jgi:putative Mg2+ transporter-C (MgtC) family protein